MLLVVDLICVVFEGWSFGVIWGWLIALWFFSHWLIEFGEMCCDFFLFNNGHLAKDLMYFINIAKRRCVYKIKYHYQKKHINLEKKARREYLFGTVLIIVFLIAYFTFCIIFIMMKQIWNNNMIYNSSHWYIHMMLERDTYSS